MIYPSEEHFLNLTQSGNVVPIYKKMLADLETPISVYQKVCGDSDGFLLESGEEGERGRYSFIGTDPLFVFSSRENEVTIRSADKVKKISGSPLEILRHFMRTFNPVPVDNLPYFWGGAVGYFGYDMVRFVEEIPHWPPEDLALPDCLLFFPKLLLIYDHRLYTLKVVYNALIDGLDKLEQRRIYAEGCKMIEEAFQSLDKKIITSSEPVSRCQPQGEVKANFSEEQFMDAVNRVKQRIFEGDIFQAVISQRLETDLTVPPFYAYRNLRSLNPSPYQYYLNYQGIQVIGSSPEMLARLEGEEATTCPIAGTRPRGQTPEEDEELAKELLSNEKEKAEHTMLVDLGRNDLGKVCRYGSVLVDKLFQVEYYSHVMHLVSEVKGTLKKNLDAIDLLKATFPAGTVSGAPKIKAMEMINNFEPVRRGLYAGAVGYIGFNGNMDTCITIRTILVSNGKVFVQAGAGIVADSEPKNEYLETLHKAAGPLHALALAGGDEQSAFVDR